MGKTPKKAAPPGGDERNLYVRRLKETSATSKASETSLRTRHRESESSSRPKLTGVQKRLTTATTKNFKSKLRSPAVKPSLGRLSKLSSNPATSSNKEGKKPAVSSKTLKGKTAVMQPESEESEFPLKRKEEGDEESVIIQTEVTEKMAIEQKCDDPEAEKNQQAEDPKDEQAQSSAQENAPDDITVPAEKDGTSEIAEPEREVEDVELQEDEKGTNEEAVIGNEDENNVPKNVENDVELSMAIEEIPREEEAQGELNEHVESKKSNELENVQEEILVNNEEKEDLQSEVHTDTESCSVDVVESTTSEVSEASESVTQPETEKDKGKPNQIAVDDVSFISFDSSIMLKDVKVKLNDCRKNNSKLYETSITEGSISEPMSRDESFGRTLRNISGRHSINRMRHVTVRNHRLSPNSSLFVNTSSASLLGDEVADSKVLRHRVGLSDTFTYNGSPVERKRKLDPEDSSEAKKIKTEAEAEASLFNSSIGLLKGLRRPIQVSTPNVSSYKMKPEKLDISGIINNDDEITATQQSENSRKWCNIM